MLDLAYRIFLLKLSRRFAFLTPLPLSLTFSVTKSCNLKCRTCNIWREHNTEQELTLREYERVFSSLKGKVLWITFDGGEPFLREDFDQIIISARNYLKPMVINVATNATLPETISKKARTIAESCPDTQIIINLSIDGIGQRHDYIRNKAGVFAQVQETYERLRRIKRDNLSIGINSTLSKFNTDIFAKLIDYCVQLEPDSYLVELAQKRDMFNNRESDILPEAGTCIELFDLISSEMERIKFTKFSALTKVIRKEYYTSVREALAGERSKISCQAGVAFGHVFANGDVWGCSVIKRIMGNLKEEGYDFKKIWSSERGDAARKEISRCDCFCTSANAYYSNMLSSARAMPKLIMGYLAWKKNLLW